MKKKNRAQEYLEQVEKLDAMIENKLAEVEQWYGIARGVTLGSEMEKVQSSGSQDKMADAVARIVDLQSEINSMIDSLVDLKREIIRTIEELNAMEYDVLHKRYIQGMTFDEIGAVKGKSKSWATTIHGRALKNLNLILDEGEKEKMKGNEEVLEKFKKYYKYL